MKEVFNYCAQAAPYRDSYGRCLVELEAGDTFEDVIKEYMKPRAWYEVRYENPRGVDSYTYEEYSIEERKKVTKNITGELVLFDTYCMYLD